MEDSKDLIIYLIFIAISILASVYKSITKKREDQKRAETARRQQEMMEDEVPGETVNPFEEFLKRQFEEFEEPEENYPLPEPVNETVVDEPVKPQVHRAKEPILDTITKEGMASFQNTTDAMSSATVVGSIHQFGMFPEAEAAAATTIRDEIHLVDIAVIDQEEEDNIPEFDAVNAVIFSEILRRKDY